MNSAYYNLVPDFGRLFAFVFNEFPTATLLRGKYMNKTENVYCDHCGIEISELHDSVYSVGTDTMRRPSRIDTGVIIPGNYHYCSNDCMFWRKHGIIERSIHELNQVA